MNPTAKREKRQQRIKLKEFFSLAGLSLLVFARNTIEFIKVASKYYSNWSFLKADMALRFAYLFQNPFTISKLFLIEKGADDIYAYGETPLTSLEIIAKEAGIKERDRLYELGCGRGRTCLWLHCFKKCSVVGIDYVPTFIKKANQIKESCQLTNIEFRLENILDADLFDASVIYLYGTNLDDSYIIKLAAKFAKLPVGTKIITVSYPLTDYFSKEHFEIMKRFTVPFTWGEGDVFVNVVKSAFVSNLE